MSKTIETHLQSNEVRIPKKSSGVAAAAEFDVSSTAAPCQYFKSSFARSLSFSQGNGGHHGGAGDNHFTRSLDFEVNYGGGLSTIPDGTSGGGGGSSQTTPSASPVFDPDRELLNGEKTKLANGISTANGGVVKTLWNYAKGSPSKSSPSPGGTPSKLASGAAVVGASSTAASHATAAAAMSGSGSSSSSARKSVEANEIEVLRLRKECQNLIEENRRLVNLAANSGYAINGLMNGNSHGGHGGHHHHGGGHGHGHGHHGGSSGSGSSSLTTSLGLGLAGGGGVGGAGPATATVAGMYSTVESVILQTQVETLQWQLKQVDSSRQMYRAVMEEVVRYLDRCYRSLDAIGHTSNIGRSKSVLQVSRVPSSSSTHNHDSDSSNASSPRARSSTNLIEVQKSSLSSVTSSSSYTKKQHQLQQQQQQQQQHQSQSGSTSLTNGNHSSLLLDDDSIVVAPSPAGSYSTFRDFTWRRSPKRTSAANQPATLPISGAEVDPEKLAQEAFRLLRTVQNLLNTQEPTLSSQSSSASSGLDSLLLLASNSGSGGGGSATGSTTTLTAGVAPVVNTRSNVGFSRKLNMRGSRLSLRSSTDDSVHSTSSSNNEDNTDRPSPPLLNHHGHHHPGSSSSSSTTSSSSGSHLVNHRHSANIDRIKEMMIASSAEDESGFSSMNSFQEIGLPLVNSTMLSSANGTDSNSSAASSTGSVSFVSDESSDIRDATVIPKLGIPTSKPAPEIPTRVTQSAAYEHHNHFVNHRRWDSAPVMLPQKLKIHQHVGGAGANGGDSDSGVSSRVLWV